MFSCYLTSANTDTRKEFNDIDSAFDHIIKELMMEGDMTKLDATELIGTVRKIYVEAGYPVNFNVWEVENDNGELVRMFINYFE